MFVKYWVTSKNRTDVVKFLVTKDNNSDTRS